MIEGAVILSGVVRHWADFSIILLLLVSNALVGFWEEHQAGNAIAALKAKLAIKAKVCSPAVDQKMDAPSDNKVDTKDLRSVTLLVTPQQANRLDLGQNKGMLHLALRNREDNKAAQAKPETLKDLRPPPLPKAPEPHPTGWIRTIRGVREGAVPIQIH